MPQTVQHLKADIDTGKTGDKIYEGFDPALAPLGTDDEAAGTPPTPEEVRLARALERRNAPAPPPEQGAHNPRPGFPAVWIILAALLLVVMAVLLAARL
ncbi:MAG TPA: hypothetical protein VE650_00265 [Acetobacteraceae bacterium]|nr:hypothetical protein [Acetobacteraceae bacterium]